MALTPQSNEAFFREVDEQVRLDAAARFWQRWGRAVIVAVIVALIALAGYLWWRSSQQTAAGVEGENMSVAFDDLAAGKIVKATPAIKTLSTSKIAGYRASAQLALADIASGKGDVKAAAAAFDAVANDTSIAQPFRDLALVRSVAVQFDAMKPERAIERLRPLAVPGNPWFGSAGELTAIAYLKLGKQRESTSLLNAIGRDEAVPGSIRLRAVQLARVSEAGTPAQSIKGKN